MRLLPLHLLAVLLAVTPAIAQTDWARELKERFGDLYYLRNVPTGEQQDCGGHVWVGRSALSSGGKARVYDTRAGGVLIAECSATPHSPDESLQRRELRCHSLLNSARYCFESPTSERYASLGTKDLLALVMTYSLYASFIVGPLCALILLALWIGSWRHRRASVVYWRTGIVLAWSLAGGLYWFALQGPGVSANLFWYAPLFILISLVAAAAAVMSARVRAARDQGQHDDGD